MYKISRDKRQVLVVNARNLAPPRRRRRNSAISAQSVRLAGLGSPASENFPIGLLRPFKDFKGGCGTTCGPKK